MIQHINGEPLDVRPFFEAHPACEIRIVQAGGQVTFICVPDGVVVTADAVAAGLPVDHYPYGRKRSSVEDAEELAMLVEHEKELVHLRQQVEGGRP